ncbi:MAG TPA: N-6 DNA methylase [Chloroflexota bacterium]|nr:N-6 DNA methylase [Chloroflexota bacterium]
MQTIARSHFITVKTEGGILPADLLQRIADGAVDGLNPADYHLSAGERPNEAINRAWNRLLGVWQTFQHKTEQAAPAETGVTMTRDWMLTLLQELGYGRLPYQGSVPVRDPLTVDRNPTNDASRFTDNDSRFTGQYPISHLYDHTPIHLVSFRQGLDGRDNSQAIKRSPHSLVQECLNRSDAYLWGFVSNGLRLRILRDNISLTRVAYVEFDLEAMFQGELYADFSLLWLLCHQSRVETQNLASLEKAQNLASLEKTQNLASLPSNCWLERWSQQAAEQGTRALDALRNGVQEAIAALGRGFLAHKANGELRQQLQSGTLNTADYYRQLLRLVYRLLFLFVAEDRGLLLTGKDVAALRLYDQYYSVSRLRRLAESRRGGPHPDLYHTLACLFVLLRAGYEPLALPALGSFLFSERATPDLDGALLANQDLLTAVRALAFTIENKVLRPVDYKNLGPEELGSVYESLLELHPQLHVPSASFSLDVAAGSERKTTGSYYTPASLIQSLLDSALEPVVADRMRRNADDADKAQISSDQKGSAKISDPSASSASHPDRTQMNADAAQIGADQKGSAKISGPSASSASHPDRTQMNADAAQIGADRKESAKISGPSASSASHLEQAILNIKVVDPACGSGHFLIAAARRLARHLARARTGDDEPGPEAVRVALRDVVGRCIFGVDINEMAVELCKVALWMETMTPGRPLAFLDAQIRCGNSLLGATPALLAGGIPDEAFTPITGDDKGYAAEWKKRNKQQRQGQLELFRADMQPWERLGDFANAMRRLEMLDDDTLAGVQAQEAEYARLVQSSDYELGKLWADAWCAAFVWVKRGEDGTQMNADAAQINADQRKPASNQRHQRSISGWPYPITEQVFRNLERSPYREPQWLKDEVRRLAAQYQFFHWHLEFPQVFVPDGDGTQMNADAAQIDADLKNQRRAVSDPRHQRSITGWTGGFDVVLGNPPWERVKLQEKEWFASRDEAIATAPNAAARQKLIAALPQTNPALHAAFAADKRKAEGESHLVRNSGKYPLCGRGDVNTFAVFAEMNRSIVGESGRAGFIVQSDIATADTYKYFFADLLDNKQLVSFYDFVNTEGLFPHVHRTHPHFCLITLSGSATTELADFAFWNTNTGHLQDRNRHFTLSAADLALLNPNTRTCPIFRSQRDAELTKAIYRRVPVLIKEGSPEVNPWGIKFFTMFHMSGDSGLFRTREQLQAEGWRLDGNRFVRSGSFSHLTAEAVTTNGEEVCLPLYEAKMLHHFDHRWATYAGLETRDVTATEKDDPTHLVLPRYWVREEEVNGRLPHNPGWLIGFRDITNTTNERTAIFSLLPKTAVGNNAPMALLPPELLREGQLLAASLCSFAFDFISRFSVGGTHMNFFILKQLPVLPPQTYHQPCPWLHNSSFLIHNFLFPRVLELTYTAYDLRPFAQDCGYHGPPFRWDEERRFLLRCELDAAYFHLYGIERDDVAYIMDTFPIVRRKDEAAHGEYRTRRVILEMYDEMAAARWDADNADISQINADQKNQKKSATISAQSASSAFYKTHLDPPPAHPDAAHPWDAAYLGPELPRDEWWQEDRTQMNADVSQMNADQKEDQQKSASATGGHPRQPRSMREPGPTLELKPPPAPPKAKRSTSAEKLNVSAASQPTLLTDFSPPQGSRSQRLKTVMGLGQPKNQAELQALVGALGDADENIRWLAGSSLARLGGLATVQMLAAFLHSQPGETAQQEAVRVLELIADTDEDEAVRTAAQALAGKR